MFVTNRLLQACRITLFTRDNCGLCTQAKVVLSDVWDRRPFVYKEVNLALPQSKSWRELYDFDIPVVRELGLFEEDTMITNTTIRYTSARLILPRNRSKQLAKQPN